MADGFDPLKNEANTASEGFNAQVETNTSNTGDGFRRPSYNSVWKRQSSNDANNQTYAPGEPQSQTASTKKFSFFNSVTRSLSRPSDSFDYSTQNSFPPPNDYFPQGSRSTSEQPQGHLIEQGKSSYLKSGENSFDDYHQEQSEDYYGQDYGAEEYYNDQKPYKKKGLASKIDRLVQRIPKFYKQSSSSPDRSESNQEFTYNQPSASVNSNQLGRELTADELALNQRYSDKTRIRFINLPVKDQIQPVDLRIHRETNKIYSCDIGRSVVEIYNIDGTFQHAIDNPTMTKFQPTAIAIAFDETIIIASHFNHCLHMYSPSDSQNTTNHYAYKQFKLGAPGSQIHQFYHPAGIAIDHNDGNLYVCDRGNYRIQVIRPEGICERVMELFVNGKKKYPLDPVRVAVQRIYDRIVCIVGAGDAICFIPKQTNGQVYIDPLYIVDENGLGLEAASGLAIDNHDRIFISDTGHHRIVICTPEGSYITSFGTQGDGLGQLKRPCGLDMTSDEILVVTDPGNKRLQLFGLIQEQTVVENNPPPATFSQEEEDPFVNL